MDSSTADCRQVLQFCACPVAQHLPTPPAYHETATSPPLPVERLRDRAAGGKIVPLS